MGAVGAAVRGASGAGRVACGASGAGRVAWGGSVGETPDEIVARASAFRQRARGFHQRSTDIGRDPLAATGSSIGTSGA
jgi:hypothetical protein